jgi:anti-anti-sigma regulatory factor
VASFQMLRISVTAQPHGRTVTLEGRIVGAWADELRACWQRLAMSDAHPVRVDLDGVTFVDAAGKAVLRAMRADGAVFAATTVMMRAIVDEIAAPSIHHET